MRYFKRLFCTKSLVFATLLFTLISYSQSQQLEDNDWYLTHFIHDGSTYDPPPGFTVELDFFDDFGVKSLMTMVCNASHASPVVYTENSFSYETCYTTLGFCPNPSNTWFDQNYLNFFCGNTENDLNYTISEAGELLTLSITDPNNNVAIYTNTLLKTAHYENYDAALYPNPTSDILQFKSKYQISGCVIYNLAGQKVLDMEVMHGNDSVDIASLPSGVYIVELNSDKTTQLAKVVKL